MAAALADVKSRAAYRSAIISEAHPVEPSDCGHLTLVRGLFRRSTVEFASSFVAAPQDHPKAVIVIEME